MGLDSVQPSVASQAVNPRQDGRDGRQPEPGREDDGKRRRQDGSDPSASQPVVNTRGEVTGRKVNTTA